MRLLSRSTPSPYDEHLTYFTVSEASEFRRLVGRSFAAEGRDVDVHSDHAEDRSGATFQLWNIGILCLGAQPHDWPGLIDEHVRLVTTPTRDLADLSQAELEAGLSLRLVDAAAAPDPDSLAYARVVAPGLLEVLAVDLHDSVATPTRDELAGRGQIGDLIARGRDNLLALLEGGELRAERDDDDGGRGRFTSVRGESFFTASLALLLAETVAHLTGEDDWGRGVLVAVPCRHRLLYRTIDTADTADALQRMHHAALRGFSREAGPISPDVYWVRSRRWAQATSWEGGKSRLLRGTGLREALRGL